MKNNFDFGLVIGRFQPPCLHHLQFLDQVVNSGIKKLLVGVGESKSFDNRNFLTGTEVMSLLIPNLDKLNIPYEITIIPDINNPPLYANHVMNFFPQIKETNTCLFTENTYTSDCFINYGHNFKIVVPIILNNRATNVRQLIADKNPLWQSFVPENVAKFILDK